MGLRVDGFGLHCQERSRRLKGGFADLDSRAGMDRHCFRPVEVDICDRQCRASKPPGQPLCRQIRSFETRFARPSIFPDSMTKPVVHDRSHDCRRSVVETCSSLRILWFFPAAAFSGCSAASSRSVWAAF